MTRRLLAPCASWRRRANVKRIAVIVVAGVGDTESVSATLLHGNLIKRVGSYTPHDTSPASVGFAVAGVSDTEWGSAERTLEDVPTATLRRARPGKDPDQVDIFEMPWSDLSRFPKGLPGFIATLFGLAVQFGTIGLEAVAGAMRDPATRARIPLGAMRFASWVAAALVIPVTAAMIVAAVNLWLVLDVPAGLPEWLMPPVVAPLGGLAVWFVAKAIDDGGWVHDARLPPRSPERPRRWRDPVRWLRAIRKAVRASWKARWSPVQWAAVIYAGTCALWVWSYWDEPSLRIASAETLLYGGGNALRAVWLFALAAVACVLLTLLAWGAGRLIKASRSGWGVVHEGGFLGRWVSGVTTMIISPLAVALVGTLLFAGVAGVAFKSAEDARWGSEAEKIRCFADASSWRTSTECGSKPDEWENTADTIVRLHAEAAQLTEQAAGEPNRQRAVELRSQAAEKTDVADAIEAAANATPVDWARALFIIITIPVTDVLAALIFVLLVGLVLFGVAGLIYRGKPGATIAKALGVLWHPATSVVLVAIALAGIAATWGVWLGWLGSDSPLSGNPWTSDRAATLTVVGIATAGLLLVSRFLPIDVRGFGGEFGKLKFGGAELGGNLEALRRRLDPAYDIASYLRVYRDKTGDRPRIIARYRALLREIARRKYDGLVIVAHSQGAVLSAATLFGDRFRRDPEREISGGYGVRGWLELTDPPDLPKNVVLITCGSPLRQSYGARMPGDYDWLWAAPDLRPLTVAWINAYWPRDYVGQAMFQDPLTRESQRRGHVFEAANAGPVARVDVCLNGKGGHVGYFTNAELAKWVDYAVALCLDEPDPPYPCGYVPAGEEAAVAPNPSATL